MEDKICKILSGKICRRFIIFENPLIYAEKSATFLLTYYKKIATVNATV